MFLGGPFVRCFHRGLVDNRFCKTVIRHRAFTWFLAIALFLFARCISMGMDANLVLNVVSNAVRKFHSSLTWHSTKHGQDWTGLDWTGLDWTGLDWTGLDWTGLDWTGLDWTGLDGWTGLDWTVGLDWTGLD